MKLSHLKAALLIASEYSNPYSLAVATGQTQPFAAGFLAQPGDKKFKETAEKEDVLFEALTNGISVEEFMAALELVSTVRRLMIEKEQII